MRKRSHWNEILVETMVVEANLLEAMFGGDTVKYIACIGTWTQIAGVNAQYITVQHAFI